MRGQIPLTSYLPHRTSAPSSSSTSRSTLTPPAPPTGRAPSPPTSRPTSTPRPSPSRASAVTLAATPPLPSPRPPTPGPGEIPVAVPAAPDAVGSWGARVADPFACFCERAEVFARMPASHYHLVQVLTFRCHVAQPQRRHLPPRLSGMAEEYGAACLRASSDLLILDE